MNKKVRKQFAFTLIELLVVIAIIGILSALIIVGMSSTTQKASIAKSQVFANSLRNSLMSNLVAEWKFEGPGVSGNATINELKDMWGGNNGIIMAGNEPEIKTETECALGNCLLFVKNNSDYFYAADGPSVDISNAITLSVWVKRSSISTFQGILSKDNGVWTSTAYELLFRNNDQIELRTSKNGDGLPDVNKCITTTPSTYSSLSQWYYIVATYTYVTDGTSVGKIYVDGQQKAISSILDGPISLNNYNFEIGRYGKAYYFDGLIDDVRLYNEAMPTSQIQQTYFAGLNKLYVKQNIKIDEYQQRLTDLTSNYAKN